MKIVGTYLNPDKRERFERSWKKAQKKRKTRSAKLVFQKALSIALRRNHSDQ